MSELHSRIDVFVCICVIVFITYKQIYTLTLVHEDNVLIDEYVHLLLYTTEPLSSLLTIGRTPVMNVLESKKL